MYKNKINFTCLLFQKYFYNYKIFYTTHTHFYKIKVNSGNEKLSISIMNDVHLQKAKLPNSITLQDGTIITNPYQSS